MTDANYQYGIPAHITANASVSNVPSVANAILVSSHTSGTVKLWDSLAASGTVALDTFSYATGSQVIPLWGMKFNTGIYFDMGGTTQDVTIIWNTFRG